MQRSCLEFLQNWLELTDRKPLVIRGARQVGKTWIVRNLAQINHKKLIELNFEKKPELSSLFISNDPQQIILNLSAIFGEITAENSILFLDEIQAAPELLAKLRWFAEDLPGLPVLAAGSLLEFVLAQHSFSMPVGRINYMHLEPMSFLEFLAAKNQNSLIDYIKNYNLDLIMPTIIHSKLTDFFKEYIVIGGMPQAVYSWVTQSSLQVVNQIHNDLLATYRDDFNKYNGRLAIERLDEVLISIPFYLGQKFIYSKVNPAIQSTTIKQALELLCKSRVCHKILGSAGNGVPLAAEIQEKYLKLIFLDVGLCSALLGLSFDKLNLKELNLINKGGLAEQVVGQLLRTIVPVYIDPALYYWHRNEKGASAEIDYLIQFQNKVVPVEVKAGSTGGLKSLHLFMGLKQLDLAVRVNSDLPSKTPVKVKDQAGSLVQYTLVSVPYYLLSELRRILD